MSKTNFDRYLAEQRREPDFAKRLKRADEVWDATVSLEVAKCDLKSLAPTRRQTRSVRSRRKSTSACPA